MAIQKGRFIVIEGVDGAGTESISRYLLSYLKKKKRRCVRMCYPDYTGPIGRLIHRYLHGQYNFSVSLQFLLYFSDFVKDRDKISSLRKEGNIIISDRYFTSTLAYQGVRGFSLKEALELAEIFRLPKPDLIIYLEVSPCVSVKRKRQEKKVLDRNEKDRELLLKVGKFYNKLIKKEIFGKWCRINGEKSIKEVAQNCIKCINKELKLNL
ncbi:dTMP kinase [bacterium]|nr:dTMP kinase [bacterium]